MADIDKTLKYYNENAQSFASGTVSVKFTKVQDKFLEKLNPDAYILDFGCGAGDRKSTRLNSSHASKSRMPSSA